MKVLVTGANGYIGSKVIKQLLDLNCEVIATDIDNKNIDVRASYISANIFDIKDDWYTFFSKPDVCLHLAWRDGFIHNSLKHMSDLSFHFNFLNNLILNGLQQIAIMGTVHEIGYWEGAVDENTPCNPLSQYGIAKNALRKSIELLVKEKKIIFQWLRAFYIYGDDLIGNSIFSKIRQAVKEGKNTFPFTTGKNKYDFISVEELAKQISTVINQKEINGIINVCSGKPVSLAEQVEWYITYNNLPIKLEYGKYQDREYDSPCIYGDNSKIKRILNIELSFVNRETIKVSVCLYCFNGEKFIKEQIESILPQLSTNDEFIISDDGSTDRTIEIIKSYEDPRIKLIFNQNKHGWVSNNENSLKHSTGDYIFWADQDDVWSNKKIEVMLKALQQNNLVICDCITTDENLRPTDFSRFKQFSLKNSFVKTIIRNRFLGCCMAFDRKLLDFVLPFPQNHRLLESDTWIVSVALRYFKVKLIDFPLHYYRRHTNNTSNGGSKSSNTIFNMIIRRIYRLFNLYYRKLKIAKYEKHKINNRKNS
ncbi:MAG: glycosyltransferase [Bacillales bacterium]|jgi:dTDP-6-deoxy-L-talose 4-dehydrogenase (NAD+)|nr:glycosyltransferase [Bacillales bacterium]